MNSTATARKWRTLLARVACDPLSPAQELTWAGNPARITQGQYRAASTLPTPRTHVKAPADHTNPNTGTIWCGGGCHNISSFKASAVTYSPTPSREQYHQRGRA